jgi:hypothetical protein
VIVGDSKTVIGGAPELFGPLFEHCQQEGLVAGVGAVVTACQRVGIRSQVQRLSKPKRGERRRNRRKRRNRDTAGSAPAEGTAVVLEGGNVLALPAAVQPGPDQLALVADGGPRPEPAPRRRRRATPGGEAEAGAEVTGRSRRRPAKPAADQPATEPPAGGAPEAPGNGEPEAGPPRPRRRAAKAAGVSGGNGAGGTAADPSSPPGAQDELPLGSPPSGVGGRGPR